MSRHDDVMENVELAIQNHKIGATGYPDDRFMIYFDKVKEKRETNDASPDIFFRLTRDAKK